MEWLGLIEPDRSRKEPLALPIWAPYLVAGVVAVAGGALSFLAVLVFRATFL